MTASPQKTDPFEILAFGSPEADTLLIQPVDDHDLEVIESEVSHIRALTGGQAFRLLAVRIRDWNKDLSPWPAPAVFGNDDFGDGAPETLACILENVLPSPEDAEKQGIRRIFIGGYSLAGLFALWAGAQSSRFDGVAAASPSVWFPHFAEYVENNPLRVPAVYLSLGDKEEKTRNPLMREVGNEIRRTHAHLADSGIDCILEWNKGNHFKEPDLRTAKGFAFLMNR